jgi:hypothetical protein
MGSRIYRAAHLDSLRLAASTRDPVLHLFVLQRTDSHYQAMLATKRSNENWKRRTGFPRFASRRIFVKFTDC